MSTIRLILAASAAALALAALTGCASHSGNAGAPPVVESASAQPTPPSAAASAAAAGIAVAAGTSSGAPSGAQASGDGTACRTSELALQVIQGPQEQSGTGNFYIQLTNVSSAACTLYGFPGVDLVGRNGASLGMKDVWTVKNSMTGSEHVQTLAPDGSSAALVTYPVEPASQTTGAPQAVAVRVIPPNQTTALTAKVDNLYEGDIRLPVLSRTLTVGPMDIDGVPHP